MCCRKPELENRRKIEKKTVDERKGRCYTTTVNKEEVPLLTLWHRQIRLIQVEDRGILCFSVCGGFFRRFLFYESHFVEQFIWEVLDNY